MQRTTEESILMSFSYGGAISILPFAVLRFIQGELIVGLVDSTLILGMLFLGTYVYITHKTKAASLILTVFALAGMTVVVHLKGPSVVFWAYPTMVAVYFILPPRMAIKLTLLAAVAMAPALFDKMEFTAFITVGITLVVNNVFAFLFAKRMQRQQSQLTQLIRLDPLTGVGNRRALNDKLDDIIAINNRQQQLVSLLVLDVDYFKRINDNYGHTVGDQVLIKLTEIINARIRETDYLYRFGGEEFVVVLTGTDEKIALKISEQLRKLVEEADILEGMTVTASIGVAEIIKGDNVDSWIDRGDRAMYHAKETGRNRVCIGKEPKLKLEGMGALDL